MKLFLTEKEGKGRVSLSYESSQRTQWRKPTQQRLSVTEQIRYPVQSYETKNITSATFWLFPWGETGSQLITHILFFSLKAHFLSKCMLWRGAQRTTQIPGLMDNFFTVKLKGRASFSVFPSHASPTSQTTYLIVLKVPMVWEISTAYNTELATSILQASFFFFNPAFAF